MDSIKQLAIQTVSAQLGLTLTESEFDYLEENWHEWLFNMGKYHNLNDIVKATILEMRQ